MEDSEPRAPGSASETRRLLARLRHDLRTPLNGILGYSGLLIEEAAERGRQDFAGEMEALRAGGRELLAHVDGLLSESRLESDLRLKPREMGVELRRAAAVPLSRIISGAERLLGGAAPDASVAEDLGRVRDCARRFEELLNALTDGSGGAGQGGRS